jgi:S1-C subfamily serine protease
MKMKKIGLIAGISFLAGAIFFALSFGFFQDSAGNRIALKPAAARAESMDTPASPEPAEIKAMPEFTFAPLVKKVRAAVVRVNSEALVERRSIFNDDLLDRLFGYRDR